MAQQRCHPDTPLIFRFEVLAVTQWAHQTADFLGLQHCLLIPFSIQKVHGPQNSLTLSRVGAWGKAQAASSGYQKGRLRGVLLGPSAVALASAVRGRGQPTALEEGRCGCRLAPVPPWEVGNGQAPTVSFLCRSTQPPLSEGNGFDVVVLLEISGCYEDVMRYEAGHCRACNAGNSETPKSIKKNDSGAVQGWENRLWGERGLWAGTAHHPAGTELTQGR